MAKGPSKYEQQYQKAKARQEKQADAPTKIKHENYGYKQGAPASITKTALDRKSANIKKNVMLFIIALLSLILVGLFIMSAIKHESPVQVVKDSVSANPPAKWKPNNDVANQSYNFDNSSSNDNNKPSSSNKTMASSSSSSTDFDVNH